ncbi:MAG: hypothetical protein D4S01_03160 [Dehalococcoidia bacterium]|nr:MAG: hypothetical protein D4S01_03160 [Dehalococcoidia bacterium]
MCNLNILIRKKNFPLTRDSIQRLNGFMMSVSSNSYIGNDDADGVYFNSGLLQRQVNKINFSRYLSQTALSNVIISHQRISTSGMEAKYTQPFHRDGFILAHNGIMGGYATAKESDTFVFFERFIKEFKKCKAKKRDTKIKKAFDICLNSRADRYSIVLYDKKTGDVYYIKENYTMMNWYEDTDMIYMTTSNSNGKFIPMLGRKVVKFTLKADELYKITPQEDYIELRGLGQVGIKPEPPVKPRVFGLEKLMGIQKGVDEDEELVELQFDQQCEFCHALTPFFCEKHAMVVCQDCIEEGMLRKYNDDYYDRVQSSWETDMETNAFNESYIVKGPTDDEDDLIDEDDEKKGEEE